MLEHLSYDDPLGGKGDLILGWSAKDPWVDSGDEEEDWDEGGGAALEFDEDPDGDRDDPSRWERDEERDFFDFEVLEDLDLL
jgi:hypothetical protein